MSAPPDARVAVVTGANAEIGRAGALRLVETGWQVIGVGRDPGRCAAAKAERMAAAPAGARVSMLRADVTAMAELARVAGEIAGLTQRLDVLIDNAGGMRDRRILTAEGTRPPSPPTTWRSSRSRAS